MLQIVRTNTYNTLLMENTRLYIRISKNLKQDLTNYCEEHGGKMSTVIKLSLRQFLKKNTGNQIKNSYNLKDERMENDQSTTIHYSSFQSPMGKMHIGVTEKGLCCIAMSDSSWHAFLEESGKRTEIKLSESDSRTDETKQKLKRYFEGKIKLFDIPVDLFAMTSFEKKVLTSTKKIQFGNLKSYQEIAESIGSPKASRAVGNALGKNPIPIVIPCHRVIKTDGTIGGFSSGLDKKRFLLKLENIHDPNLLN
ncbi:methylated-DNA--[protein]-cysteine S-methyltransferase [candidate division KSB1 bacterium]|nr:methylated-DNA--[protein]-cysteine S-methyltransferase [candidate division KSB1 bacterium]